MAVSVVQTGCTVLTQSVAVLLHLPSSYLSFALFSPSFSPTNREIKLRKKQKNKTPQTFNFYGNVSVLVSTLNRGGKLKYLFSLSPWEKKVVKTLCSEWMKCFVVNSFGISFSVELDCAQMRWSHSWGACWVKPELSIYSGQISTSLWAWSLGSFNSFIETYTMSYFFSCRQRLISCKGGRLLRGGETLKKRQGCQSESILKAGSRP